MAVVRFAGRTVPAEAGRDLLDLLLEEGAPISYLCMSGSCQTCRVRVLAGSEHLEPITAGELAHFPASRGEVRLACQAIMRATGDVELVQDDTG